jgi:hypothetical protein
VAVGGASRDGVEQRHSGLVCEMERGNGEPLLSMN